VQELLAGSDDGLAEGVAGPDSAYDEWRRIYGTEWARWYGLQVRCRGHFTASAGAWPACLVALVRGCGRAAAQAASGPARPCPAPGMLGAPGLQPERARCGASGRAPACRLGRALKP